MQKDCLEQSLPSAKEGYCRIVVFSELSATLQSMKYSQDKELQDEPPLLQWQREELDRRLAEYEADPESGSTLKEVFARTRSSS